MKEKHLDEKKTRKQTKQVKKKETRRNTGWNKYRWDACLVYSSFGVMLRILLTMEGFWRSPTFPIHYWCLCIFCLLIYCASLIFLFCASQHHHGRHVHQRRCTRHDRVQTSSFRPMWILFSFLRTTAGWVSAWNTVGHSPDTTSTIAKSFPTQMTQLTISCIFVRRLSLYTFDFCFSFSFSSEKRRRRVGSHWFRCDRKPNGLKKKKKKRKKRTKTI